jgi:tRNA pseudouridine55 synthase
MATGVLVLCIGPATRLSEYVMESTKTYLARLHFGVETDTYDAEGAVIAENPAPVSREVIEAALDAFRGDILQVPPMYSAIQKDGRRLYDLARAGIEVEREARPVTIHALDLITWEPPYADLRVQCSPGTYIRSLAYDLGRAVGVGAHLAALERSASGLFTVENAVSWPDLETAMQAGTWQQYLLPPDLALSKALPVHLSADDTTRVWNGMTIPAEPGDAPLARAYDPAGNLIAVLERRGVYWKPEKVFHD